MRLVTKEKQIIDKCLNGDRWAFKELYDLHKDRLYTIAIRMLNNRPDAEDALQNCFIRLFKHLDHFRFESTISTYLTRILMNCCYDIIEKKKNQPATGLDVLINIPAAVCDKSLQIDQAIRLLPEKMRACFILHNVEGFKQNEVAEILNITTGTVKAHVHQAKARLREMLKQE